MEMKKTEILLLKLRKIIYNNKMWGQILTQPSLVRDGEERLKWKSLKMNLK